MEYSVSHRHEEYDPVELLFVLPDLAGVRDFFALARRWDSKRCHSFARKFQDKIPFGYDGHIETLGRIVYAFRPNQTYTKDFLEVLSEMDALGMERAIRQIALLLNSFLMLSIARSSEDIVKLVGPLLPEIRKARMTNYRRMPRYESSTFARFAVDDENALHELVSSARAMNCMNARQRLT